MEFKTLRVCIDPGHGQNYNRGCVAGYYESNQMYKLAQYQKGELEKYEGVTVILTKTALNQCPEVYDRGQVAVKNKCDVFISDHSNAVSGSSSACGVTIFRSVRRPDSVTLSKLLGEAIVSTMKEVTGNTYLRGNGATIKYSAHSNDWDYYGVLKGATASGSVMYPFLIEHGFHTNPAECRYLNDDNNLRKLAKAEVDVLASYFGLTLKDCFVSEDEKDESTTTTAPSNPETCPYVEPASNIKKGSEGEGVKWIQWHLNKHGYDLEIDGDFGALTDKAVRDFQGKSNLTVDGIVGKNTREKLKTLAIVKSNPYSEPTVNVRKGANGDNVKWIQWELVERGYELEIDGDFGPATDNAVRDFQNKCNITVDGIVGEKTREMLNGTRILKRSE